MHGLIFFYIQKFAEAASHGTTTWASLRSTTTTGDTKYLPSGVYPDADAVQLLDSIAQTIGKPLPDVVERFGEFLAPHLVKVAGAYVEPSWTTLDLIEHTESIIHAMIRKTNPGAAPPVLETVRSAQNELQLVYSSRRRLCRLVVGLIRGMARHYEEDVTVEEPSCMLRGDPFCSFVIQTKKHDKHSEDSPLSETIAFPAPSAGLSDARPAPVGGNLSPGPTASSPADADGIPALIGGYTILRVIGRGGMGRVYLARDEQLKRDVAIKMMHPVKARDPGARRRFLQESRAAAAVEHPHVMTIHQVGEEGGLPFIVMQRLDGLTLGEYRDSVDRMPLREALRIARETAEGLAAAHRRGLIHRDIKPDNIFLEAPGRSVKIIDFGLAREASDEAGKITVDGAVVGTPAYMAPERINGQEVDAKSDLFGLGVILYELLAGRLPFDGKSMVSVLAAIARGTPTGLREVAPDVPPAVSDLVMRLLAHDKANRPADAHAVAEELAALEKGLPRSA